jgi:hypothetical protein
MLCHRVSSSWSEPRPLQPRPVRTRIMPLSRLRNVSIVNEKSILKGGRNHYCKGPTKRMTCDKRSSYEKMGRTREVQCANEGMHASYHGPDGWAFSNPSQQASCVHGRDLGRVRHILASILHNDIIQINLIIATLKKYCEWCVRS